MAATTVENLTINIKRTGDNASATLNGLSQSLNNVKGSSRSASKGLGSLASSLQRIAYYRIIRSVIKAIGQAFQEGAQNAYFFSKAVGGDLAAALDLLATKNFTMTNQLGASWATLLQTIQPILLKLIELVRMAAEIITQFFAVLGGKSTYLKAIDYSKDWAETTASGAKAAKEWKNQLMGFDEINRLEDSSGSGGGGGGVLPNYSQMFEEVPINSKLSNLVDMIKNNLVDLELFASGALLGVGLILTLTGANVPLGLGLIAAGAYGLCKTLSENWDYLTSNLSRTLSTIELVGLGALFGIGAVLAFSGANPVLGIALMAAGLLGLATIAALNWDEMPENIKRTIRSINLILGISLLGVGAILAFTGANIPLGIGLMVAGAANLAAAAALSEGGLVETVRKTLAGIMLLVGPAMAAIGLIILALCPAMWPLGIGLIVAGIGATVASYLLDPSGFVQFVDTIIRKIQEAFEWAKTATKQLNEFAKAGQYSADIGNGRTVTYSPNKGGVYASGGFPDEGEIFVAREQGPELVGQIGRKSAVANNDQIIQGISTGVYNAVLSAMSSSGGKDDSVVNIYLDGERIARTTTKYQRQFAREGTM